MASPGIMPPRAPIFIMDNQRTMSQLLHQYSANHPQLESAPGKISSWAWPISLFGQERLVKKMNVSLEAVEADKVLEEEIKKWYKERVNVDVDRDFTIENVQYGLLSSIEKAEQEGRIAVSREHRTCLLRQDLLLELLHTGRIANSPSNPTYIPDSLYAIIHNPLILIRHPAKVIPSYYRSQRMKQKFDISDEPMRAWTMQSFGRFFYDHLAHADPIIVDGDDVLSKPKELCAKLCEVWGIDFGGCQFEWEEGDEMLKSFPWSDAYMRTIFHSRGILKKEVKEVDVDAEQVKWEEEFGKDVATAP